MAYQSWSVVFGEQPSASKWNILGTNDAAFNNGTGLPQSGADAAAVTTSETTTSTSYTNLATTTDSVTVTVNSNQKVLVSIKATMANNTGAAVCYVGIDTSGANTESANDNKAIRFQAYTTNANGDYGASFLYTSLSTGSTTFKMKYRVDAGTGAFLNRRISAIPL